MKIHVHIENMRDAERLSHVLNDFPYELTLTAGRYSADPKSTLGVLAMMYTDKNMTLDTGDMPDRVQIKFIKSIAPFLPEAREIA